MVAFKHGRNGPEQDLDPDGHHNKEAIKEATVSAFQWPYG